ncbi:uncharacterized protein LOC122070811 isoform X2 [Macadamia integrifolia]|uniref:uncharacterized protein LOC122070811 isoform X2 n=1 Tax=Macadamia integrifolia TaxID=60698 RepID=UPI001C5011A7|nr:uncharacterized protein LOC122070811 isoform X2 [Macadamia integrifolia]
METSRNVNFSHQPGDAFDNDESAGFFTSNIKESLIQMSSKVSGGAGTADSEEGSSETFDQFNPIVDSPCWKGAPASCQSPFGVTEVVSPYFHVEEFEGCNSSNLGGPHILSVNADDAVAVSSQKKGVNVRPYENENGEDGSSSFSKGMSSVNFLSVEDELKDSVKAAHYHSKVNIENEILYSDVIQELTQPRKGHVPSVYSKSSELKPSHMKQMSYGNNITSAELLTSEATVADSGMDIKDLGQDGSSCVQFNAVEHSSSLPFSLASVPVGLAKQFGGASDTRPKIDIQLLLNAMDNLSELLLSSCSNDVEALKEQDHEVICRVVNNLDACLSNKGGLMRSLPQIQFPESSTCCLRKPTDPQKVTWTCRSQVNSVEAVDVPSQNDLDGKMHCTDSGQQDNKLQDFVSIDGETGIKIDNDMSQVMKKIMEEKFDNELQQTILFKNLWLEAEAALCSVKYEERYARMKIEMENCERYQEKGAAGKPIDTVGQLSTCVSRDLIIDDMLTQGMEENTLPDTTTLESIPTGIASQAKNVEAPVPCQAEDSEASVMSRFRILKCRVEKCSSMNEGHPAESTGIGAYAGREDTISSPCLNGTQNIRTEIQPINVVDGVSSERINPSPFLIDRSEDGHLEVTIRPDMQHHGTSCTEEKIELDSDFPWQQDPLKEFGVCISEEPVNALIPNRDGNQSIGDGFDSPSSDWEHVLKEELKWQN